MANYSDTSTPTVLFTVRRNKPELIKPSRPTPREIKPLSDIDDQESLLFYFPVIQIYRNSDDLRDDPVKVIRESLAEALVFYYPLAGRLREIAGGSRKLVVDCTGELGLLFVEADADAKLDDFGEFLRPPFPCLEKLLLDVPASSGILHCPLILVQVTRLRCGGLILGFHFNHTMCDGSGFVQFMNTVAEIARHGGYCSTIHTTTVTSVWDRHLLNAPVPPMVTCNHREYDEVVANKINTTAMNQPLIKKNHDLLHRSFIFTPREITSLRRSLPPHLQNCSTFELLTACLWKCRTIALQPYPDEKMHLLCIVNARKKIEPPIPTGYYGNVIAFSLTVSTAKNISENPLSYTVNLVRKAKEQITGKYMKSLASLIVQRGRPHFSVDRRITFVVSDLTRVRFDQIDYGWGKPVYGGPAEGGAPIAAYLIPLNGAEGERSILVPIALPGHAMESFVHELGKILKDEEVGSNHSWVDIGLIRSSY